MANSKITVTKINVKYPSDLKKRKKEKKEKKKGDKNHMNMLGGRPEAHGMRGFMKEERSHVKDIFLEVCGFSEMRK